MTNDTLPGPPSGWNAERAATDIRLHARTVADLHRTISRRRPDHSFGQVDAIVGWLTRGAK